MTLPFTLPDWLPWWVPIVLLVPALLYALAFLFMPFSVIGVKGRLEVIEARLDEIQGEIRSLALRLPEPSRALDFEEVYSQDVPPARDAAPPGSRAAADPTGLARTGRSRFAPGQWRTGRGSAAPPSRSEPRAP